MIENVRNYIKIKKNIIRKNFAEEYQEFIEKYNFEKLKKIKNKFWLKPIRITILKGAKARSY